MLPSTIIKILSRLKVSQVLNELSLYTRLRTPISCQELNNTLLFHQFSGLKEMIFPMMWSSLETDGINDMENPKITERLIDMNI